jgi:signal transduction histidine kinase
MAGQSAPASPEAAELTELRAEVERLRAKLEKEQRLSASVADAAEQFVSGLAHDLKNPLAAIKISVQGAYRALERGRVLGIGEWSERLGRIENAVQQTRELIAAARARIGSSMLSEEPPRRERVDLAQLVRDTGSSFREQVGDRLRLECPTSAVWVMADQRQLGQAIQAIVDNALKFSEHDRPVRLDVLEVDRMALIRCRDEGIGIPQRDLPFVGDLFYRGENVVGRYKGAGISLTLARRTLAQNGGELQIDSIEGAGSTVTLRLPLG